MFILSGRIIHHLSHSRLSLSPVILLLLIPFTISVRAQGGGGTDFTGTGGQNTIQGRIYFPSGRAADMRAKVVLESMTSSRLSVMADGDGAFRFKNLSPGSYTIVIEAGDDYEKVSESIFIEGNSNLGRGTRIPMMPRTVMVPIYLRAKLAGKAKTENKPGVLNAALANVPKPALELYDKALQSIQAGDGKGAIEQLRAAVSIHPDFAVAFNALGVEYLKLGDVDRALDALRTAVRLSPESFVPRLNYGIAFLEKKQFADAEAQLRQALQKNEASPSARMYLGIALISLRRYDEAETEFQHVTTAKASEFAIAHKYLGGLYWRKQQYQKAVGELETYLRLMPKAKDAGQIRATIDDLRKLKG